MKGLSTGLSIYELLQYQKTKAKFNVELWLLRVTFDPDPGAAYICTEDAFPHKRLQQLTESFLNRRRDLGRSNKQLSDNIYVEHAATIVRTSTMLQFSVQSSLDPSCKQ